MDHESILDLGVPPSAAEGNASGISAHRSAPSSVSAGIAAADVHAKSAEAGLSFPGEDGGRSLAAMACRDLDAALQLLAERAQYISGASGTMIALRRGQHNDMLCRASAGSNAPELGALFSMEHGFSGESVRTRQLLRCDDAERDSRVNREGCRRLGIASVVVAPVLSEKQVIGVFELFSGKAHAFDDRALSALQRLSEMVETAVKYAVAAQTVSQIQEQAAAEEILSPMGEIKIEVEADTETILATDDLLAAPLVMGVPPSPETITPVKTEPLQREVGTTPPQKAEPLLAEPLLNEFFPAEPEKPELKSAAEPMPKKSLFWSAAVQAPANVNPAPEPAPVPAGLRNLQKCQACGFPVSQGRIYCVECEEKQWRGQRLPQPTTQSSSQPATSRAFEPPLTPPKAKDTSEDPPAAEASASMPRAAANSVSAATTVIVTEKIAAPSAPVADRSTLFLASVEQSESWLAANKYILAALLLVAIVIAAIVWLN